MHKSRSATALVDAVALVILVAETALVAVIAVGYVAYALMDRSFSGLGLSLAAVAAILAAGLGLFTRGFAKRRRFALGGAMTWQLMQASVGVWLLGAFPIVGALLIAAAVMVAVAVFKRQAALGRQEQDDLDA
ncbi:hypothetical protein [Demequina lutea]|uniref:Putative membrane protein n=1 Tax=Demequina lutea TaxID=431489 RepID=A0A7Y9Z8K8_9MICO|nr:hypothetical protein [Demequina lutea]NYI40774.1 putative membrane protein [Demequina lutea]